MLLKKEFILEYLKVTIGVAFIAFGLESFYIPNGIAAGGLSGFALVLNHYLSFLSISSITLLFNIVTMSSIPDLAFKTNSSALLILSILTGIFIV